MSDHYINELMKVTPEDERDALRCTHILEDVERCNGYIDVDEDYFYIVDSCETAESIGINNIEGIEWGFSDEYLICMHCRKAFHIDDKYWINEGMPLCEKCVEDDYVGEYLEYLNNNPKDINVCLDVETLEYAGYTACDRTYYGGMRDGDNDRDPKKIMDVARELHPDMDFIFNLDVSSPFDCEYTIWRREVDYV